MLQGDLWQARAFTWFDVTRVLDTARISNVGSEYGSNHCCYSFAAASAGAVDEADFENAFYECPDVKVCRKEESSVY